MFHLFTAMKGWTAIRRALVAVCALAFIFVSSAHAVHHFDGHSEKTGIELSTALDTNATLDADDTTKDKNTAKDQCCGCVSIAMFDFPMLEVAFVSQDIVSSLLAELNSISPTLDVPYPIVAI